MYRWRLSGEYWQPNPGLISVGAIVVGCLHQGLCKMVYSLQQRIAIVEAYVRTGSIKETRRTTHRFSDHEVVPGVANVGFQ